MPIPAWQRALPWALILLRALLGPVILLTAFGLVSDPLPGGWYVVVLVAAMLSDVYDGVLARRFGVATALLRIWDCWVDNLFWLCAGIGLFWLHPAIFLEHLLLVYTLLGLEFVPEVIYLLRFRSQGCAHAYLSKAWGISLLITLSLGFLAGGHDGFTVFALSLGILSQVERIGIALILPARICDIPSIFHAYQIRLGKPIRRHPWFHSDTAAGN